MKKHAEFLESFKVQLNDYFKKYSFDMSDSWGTASKVYIINAYTLSDNFKMFGLNRHEALNIIYRNKKYFEFSERYRNTSDYDCTGNICRSGMYVKKCSDMLLFINSASYDI